MAFPPTVRNAVRVLSGNPLVRTAKLGQNPRGVWEIRYSEPQGEGIGWRSRTQSTRTTDKVRAERFLDEWLKAAAQVEQETEVTPRRTIAELCEIYAQAKPGQRVVLNSVVRCLGQLTVAEINETTMRHYRALRPRVKDGSVRRELGALVACLNYAKKRRLFEEPVPLVDLPPQSEPRLDYLSRTEAQLVWDKAREWGAGQEVDSPRRRVWVFTAIAMETAARHGAISDLTWDRVNLERRTIDLYNPRFPRNRKHRPVVPISDDLLAVLREQAGLARKDWTTGKPVGLVLGASGYAREAFRQFAASIGMEDRLTPHLFRHTWASLAAIDGEPLFHIAKMLGDTLATVEKTYAKLAPSDLHAIANRRRRG
jgi:integrase